MGRINVTYRIFAELQSSNSNPSNPWPGGQAYWPDALSFHFCPERFDRAVLCYVFLERLRPVNLHAKPISGLSVVAQGQISCPAVHPCGRGNSAISDA